MSKEFKTATAEEFMGEVDSMDLSALKDKTFMVSVSTGKRDSHLFLQSTIKGPFTYGEMVEEVHHICSGKGQHAHVLLTCKERNKKPEFLDECTIDYIEARYKQLIEELLFADIMGEEATDYEYQAQIISDEELGE